MTQHIAIDLFRDVEELDAIGPWEVLSSWAAKHPYHPAPSAGVTR